jgi:hypothetical protein
MPYVSYVLKRGLSKVVNGYHPLNNATQSRDYFATWAEIETNYERIRWDFRYLSLGVTQKLFPSGQSANPKAARVHLQTQTHPRIRTYSTKKGAEQTKSVV